MASNPKIPKEQLSAYQRWELASFDEKAQEREAPEGIKLPTAQEIERIHQQAYQEGFAAGMRDGRAQGEAFSLHMKDLLTELERSMQRFEEAMAGDILELALEIARQLVRQSIRTNPEVILGVVREAIESLPQLTEHPVLILNPEDANTVRQMLAYEYQESVWRVVEDPQMERGGCRLETAESEIDATLEGRWKRIAAALGSDADWHS
jgi:flagellar assembly protein FliH